MANEEEPQQKLIITDSSKISEDMAPYYLKETFSDIQIILSDKTIHAHKIVLAARCKYFESLLMQDPKQAQIELMNAPSKAFETILYYIYTGTVVMASLDENYVSDVLKLAHEYSLKTLVQTNAHDMDELRKTCHTLIDEYVSQTLEYGFFNVLTQKSMVNLLKRDAFLFDEIEVFNIAANWCKINKDVDNLVIGCVRFPCLTRNEILNVVRPFKIVDDAKLLNVLTTIENNGTQKTLRFGGQLKDKNLARAEYNVKVVSGLNTTMLFEESRNSNDGAYHNRNDKNGITVDLGQVKCFNYITMCIVNYRTGYYIEVSTDLQKWKKVIDYTTYSCYSRQNLYFEQQKTRYIRVVMDMGHSARICMFQVFMSSTVPKMRNQIVYPSSNIITSQTRIWIIRRDSSPTSCILHLCLNQPYIISQIKVKLRFYSYISVIEAFEGQFSNMEIVAHSINEDKLLTFKKRTINFIQITGQLSPNKTKDDIQQFLEDIECF
ncbi:BTB/POZ domain-containing protein 9-like isoform X4 [Zophobas morio]|uniref:BTB/POZ domain-containing protein 9-like isoform X4 n=1 Tax=Zophobas morio TaxID=2755281 RepID=UPI003082A646